MIPDEATWVVFGVNKKMCRTVGSRRPKMFGAAKRAPKYLHKGSTSQTIYLFSEGGYCSTIPVHQLPQTEDVVAGTDFSDLCSLSFKDRVVAMQCLPSRAMTGFLFLVTALGQVKRMDLNDLPGVMTNTFSVMNITKGDKLLTAFYTGGEDTVLLTSGRGYAIRFQEEDVRPTGLNSGGMRGIRLSLESDRIVGAARSQSEDYVWSITTDGVAKMSRADEYTIQGRGGSGRVRVNLGSATRSVVAATAGALTDSVIVLTNKRRVKRVSLRVTEQLMHAGKGEINVIELRDGEQVAGIVEYRWPIESQRYRRADAPDEVDASNDEESGPIETTGAQTEHAPSEDSSTEREKLTLKQLELLLDEADTAEEDANMKSNGADPGASDDD